jgi:hypothetical protein
MEVRAHGLLAEKGAAVRGAGPLAQVPAAAPEEIGR